MALKPLMEHHAKLSRLKLMHEFEKDIEPVAHVPVGSALIVD